MCNSPVWKVKDESEDKRALNIEKLFSREIDRRRTQRELKKKLRGLRAWGEGAPAGWLRSSRRSRPTGERPGPRDGGVAGVGKRSQRKVYNKPLDTSDTRIPKPKSHLKWKKLSLELEYYVNPVPNGSFEDVG